MFAAAFLPKAALAIVLAQDLVQPSIRLETRAGIAPELRTLKSKPFVLTSATPAINFRLSDRHQGALINLSSRLLLREPSPTKDHEVLVLHQLNLSHRMKPDGRWRLRFDLYANYGREDYTTFRETLASSGSSGTNPPSSTGSTGATPTSGTGSTPSTNLTVPASLQMMSAGVTWDARYLLSRRADTSLQLSSLYRDSIGSSSPLEAPRPVLQKQSINSVTLDYSESVTRTQRLSASVQSSYYHVRNRMDAVVTRVKVGVLETTSKWNSFYLDAGINHAEHLKYANTTQSNGLSPLATMRWDAILSNQRRQRITSSALSGVDWGFEPVSGTGATRIPIAFTLSAQLDPLWRIGLQASYTTSFFQNNPVGGKKGASYALVSMPVTYRRRDGFTIESGVRGSAIAPRFAGPSEFTAVELWGYLSLTMDYRQRVDTL